ncbi:MAG: flagellar basal body rod protein FlgB [Planctomycetota bacterium]|jgi:flagellar basal-body rod protein FlgB|nr:flagellar basal body rod protein FlgB [Planctomycetota bacterium]MDP6369124.1 flagellar basal body rod protein FlgB [Planctomycetota bacterium]MDP6837768.1 flagellar basal body rod protein FlgB [Planctomycetota bacterium]MDP6954596.1 flagellar basal body rod protein FlgB [Planctomycetota bacterium]
MNITGTNTNLLLRLLSAASMRNEVISNNIANQNTPNYTRQVVRFEDLLSQRLSHGAKGLESITPQVESDTITPASPDGNNVTPELELNSLRENRLLYEMYSTILSGKMDLVRTSITGGR